MTAPSGSPVADEPRAPLSVSDVLAANAEDDVRLTDRGSGRRFAELYRDAVRYVVDRGEWIVRDGLHWRPDPAGLVVFGLTGGVIRAIRNEAERLEGDDADDLRERYGAFAHRSESEGARLRMISSAREHSEITAYEDDLDADLDDVAAPNGVVNLLTGELRDVRPGDICTRATSVAYDPDATSPLLDQYLETFVPDPEDQEVLFAVLGTCLRGGNPTRLFPVFIGGTTSGKSQLIAALDRLLGDYICTVNASVFRGNLDDKPRPDLVRAMHHRIAYAVEASKIWELHADQVKRITGGDEIPYRDLYSRSVEKKPRFTPLIVTNEMPRIKGADQALRRRMLVVSFDRSLPPELEDTRVRDRFVHDDACLRALLARVVAGARSKLLVDGIRWSLMPKKYAETTLDSFGKLDHIDLFLEWLRDEEVLVAAEAEAPLSHCARTSELHKWYKRWLKEHGNRQDRAEDLSLDEFVQALRGRGWTAKRSNGTRWVGVKLTRTTLWVP